MGDEPSSASRFVECLRSKPAPGGRIIVGRDVDRRLTVLPYSDNRSHRPPASQVPSAPWRSRPQALALR